MSSRPSGSVTKLGAAPPRLVGTFGLKVSPSRAAAVAVCVVEAPAPVGQAFDVARLGEPPLTGLRREMDAVRRDGAVDARRSRGLDPVVEAYPAVRKDDRAWIRQALIRR